MTVLPSWRGTPRIATRPSSATAPSIGPVWLKRGSSKYDAVEYGIALSATKPPSPSPMPSRTCLNFADVHPSVTRM